MDGARQFDAQAGVAIGFRRVDGADYRADATRPAGGAVEMGAADGQASQRETEDQCKDAAAQLHFQTHDRLLAVRRRDGVAPAYTFPEVDKASSVPAPPLPRYCGN
jgi:hypothetical protein